MNNLFFLTLSSFFATRKFPVCIVLNNFINFLLFCPRDAQDTQLYLQFYTNTFQELFFMVFCNVSVDLLNNLAVF